ncbi:MAG: hypothetical protein ACOZD0_06800 [Pseudomonadota bacterium]
MSKHGPGVPGAAPHRRLTVCLGALVVLAAAGSTQAQDERQVYRCPGNLYTDALSVKEAAAKGCKTLEGAPVTVVQSPRRSAAPAAAAPGARNEARVEPTEQRNRDAESRRILEAELAKEEQALAQLQKDYNNGEPERRGDERNFQKYLDRVNEMKAAIERKQADIAALKREIAKLGGSAS